jgi:hypothetical protein
MKGSHAALVAAAWPGEPPQGWVVPAVVTWSLWLVALGVFLLL